MLLCVVIYREPKQYQSMMLLSYDSFSVTFAAADLLLWRNKKISASVLGGATAVWVLFELLEYHFLTLVCHILILVLAVLFLWSNAHTFIHK